MDEVDIENTDDLNELEARLYAQIHHEPSGDCDFSATYKEASPVRQVTTTSVINNKSIDRTRVGRYWNDKTSTIRTPSKAKSSVAEVIQSEKQPSLSGEIEEQPAETVDKSFQPPVKTLSDLRVNPFASGNGPKTKGSSSQTRGKNAGAVKSKKNDPKENKGPFARQMTKLASAVKYDGKKQKAKAAKAKMKKSNVDLIVLLSSDESELDDVIEVPLPSPKILTIDSSSDEENPKEDKKNFAKPHAIKDTSSRCTSPCSVVSDDFIGQNDRSRLLEENDRADDEDLLMLQEDVDSLMENPEKSVDKSSESFIAPAQIASSPKSSSDYRVTQNNFRALDVYESESDIQDSVYSKGSKNNRLSLVVRLEHESSSDDDVEEVDVSQKMKRLRKRRASSSNKESETYVDSTDSEEENIIENEGNRSREGVVVTRVPYIARGEAIERSTIGDQSITQRTVNSSDNEFIATLNTLAQGTSIGMAANASVDESDEEAESITARAVAESVIRRENRLIQSAEPVVIHNEEANDAIPMNNFAELEKIFEKIDSFDKTPANFEDSAVESDDSVELVAPLPVPGRSMQIKKSENDINDPVYNVVYCEGATLFGGIGWNDEMRKFYNSSWNGERFSVKAICSRMKTSKSLWKIYTEDRFPKYRKHSNQKCMNCCEFGHVRARCPKPRKIPVCYMCGERGHHEPRCPNTVCLRCGNKTRMFTKSCNACNYQNRLICPICKVRGHNINLCPDKWRRYHSTTKPNEYPNSKVEYKNRKFCCICGCRGHLAEHCRNALRFTEYPMFISEIRSHQKSYDDLSIKTIRSGIGYNLMYKPEEDLSFELAENKTRQQYYGRFLIAVGLGHLLKRKRKIDAPTAEEEATDKKAKPSTTFKEYVVNPFAKAALEKSSLKPTTSTNTNNLNTEVLIDLEDVTEADSSTLDQATPANIDTISTERECVNIDVDEFEPPTTSTGFNVTSSPDQVIVSTCLNVDNVSEVEPSTSTFKTPDVTSTSGQTTQKEHDVCVEVMDSDSNYSFSEHFEPDQRTRSPVKAREMEPLPDFIPITDDGDQSPDEGNLGISKRFVSVDTDDENTEMGSKLLPDIPCEAKIYLTNFHSKFLLSPDGNKFLVEKSKVFDVKARLDWTSVGHILVIFGLRVNQDKFHAELLHKFRELSDKLNRKQLENSQKVPRKTEVLIRFLREHLNQLLTNLGNVNDLIKRLNFQENQHTKSGWKLAEKTRRSLNMILIGQAGLRNGSKHLDNLLSHLRNLIDECKEDVVPNDVRDDIDSHWRLIFSSHRHEKYHDLVEAYNHMQVKNRFQNINIDPRLLGKKVLDTTLTKAQKDKMDTPVNTRIETARVEKQSPAPKLVPNPMSTKYQARQVKIPISEKKGSKNVPTNSPKQQKQQQETVVNSPVAKKIKAVNEEWETKCVNLLTEIDKTDKSKKGGPVLDSKASSVFWSREAMKYIDECLQVGKSNPGVMEKLYRVQNKSQKGLLSYNDYRAIIKIHNTIKGKQ